MLAYANASRGRGLSPITTFACSLSYHFFSQNCFILFVLYIHWEHQNNNFYFLHPPLHFCYNNWRAACKKLVSDFLGRIVFPRPNELNFGMWPSTSWKNIPPYLSLLVSLSFSTNNVCKSAVFFLAVSFPKKAFVFPNNRISEARICCQCWLKKISRKRKTKQQKKLLDNVFLLSPRSHAKIELIWTRKKIRPK